MAMSKEQYPRKPLDFDRLDIEEMQLRGDEFVGDVLRRRSVRDFSPEPVPREMIERAIIAAHSAPSGANRQPWHFVAVSNPDLKNRIREAAEVEEREFYEGDRATPEWLEALAQLGTDWQKPFLEIAPWIVVVFKETYGVDAEGNKATNFLRVSVTICARR